MIHPKQPLQRLGERFEVEGFLRPGRFGDLWLGRGADGRLAALKLLKPELFKDGEAIRRFQREVRLLLAFEHPYLLRVLDHGTTSGGDPYLVLEHVDGELLSALVARGALPLDRVRRIGAQVARVLAAAAARGIVHRGLCPDAILVHGSGAGVAEDGERLDEVKVLDFGLAVVLAPDRDEVDEPRLTEYGQRIGDPVYMSPEYVLSFECDARSDLYALGVLLYELATGDPPFRGRAIELYEAHVSAVPEPPSQRVPELPSWFDALLVALLDKDPAARPDATAVARALVAGCFPV